MASIEEYLDSRISGETANSPVPESHGVAIELDYSGAPMSAPASVEAVAAEPEAPAIAVDAVPETAPVTVDEPEGQPLSANWRLHFDTLEGKQMAALIKSGVDPKDAAIQAYGINHAPSVATPVAQPIPAPQVHDELSAKEARIAEIQAEIKSYVEREGADVGVTLTPDLLAKMDEKDTLLRELPDLKIQAREVENYEAEEDRRAFKHYAELAVTQFPDAAKPGTSLYNEVARQSAEVISNHDHPLWGAPDRAHLIAVRAATKLGIAPVTAQPAQVIPTPAIPATQVPAQAQPRAFSPAAGTEVSGAPRIAVTTGPANPMEAYRQSVATSGRGTSGIMAGLDSMIQGFAGKIAARA